MKHTETDRYYPPVPRLGVGVLVRYKDTVLLVKRGQQPAKGEWSLPGGLVELGESLKDAIHREIWEECSIRIELHGLLDTFEFIDRDEYNKVRYHYIVMDYWATLKSGRAIAGSDVADVQWFTARDIQMLDCSDTIKKLAAQVFLQNS